MEISIIIVNYKSDTYLKKCLASIKRFPPKVLYEVVVIDNNQDNVGFAKGVNKGIKKSTGKYFLLLNPDSEVKEGAIQKLYEFAKEQNDAGVVGPKLVNPDGSIQSSVFKFPTIARAIGAYWLGNKMKYEKYAPAKTAKVDAVVGAAFLITPEAIKKVGLLDERYFMYYEDLDYCRRAGKAGLSVYYVSAAEVIHVHGASGGENKLLIESAKKYHGLFGYLLLTFILWSGQKCRKLLHMG